MLIDHILEDNLRDAPLHDALHQVAKDHEPHEEGEEACPLLEGRVA